MSKYIPPAKQRELEKQKLQSLTLDINEDEQLQQNYFLKSKKKIISVINKITLENIQEMIFEAFSINLIRFRGLLIDEIIQHQIHSNSYTAIYTSFICVINSKIPEIGKLLLTRLVLNFRKYYKSNDKEKLISTLNFISNLLNFKIANEVLIFQILLLLLNWKTMTNTSIQLSIEVLKFSGNYLITYNRKVLEKIFEKLREILLTFEELSDKNEYLINEIFKLKSSNFSNFPMIPNPDSLDLVENDDLITHLVELDQAGLKSEKFLNDFMFDSKFQENEDKYEKLKKEILGDDEKEEYYTEDEANIDAIEEEEVVVVENQEMNSSKNQQEKIQDMTETTLINFQKAVYLTVMSAMNSDEAVHKLIKLEIPGFDKKKNNTEFQERLIDLIVKSSSLEKSYNKYQSLICCKLCSLSKTWHSSFMAIFKTYYETCHLFKANQLKNIAKFWGFLLASDVLSYEVFKDNIREFDEESTSSAQRIFIKVVFETIVETIGVAKSKEMFQDDKVISGYLSTLFPDSRLYLEQNADGEIDTASEFAEHLRFSINFFTAIGLGVLTEKMREDLQSLLSKFDDNTIETNEEQRPSSKGSDIDKLGNVGSRRRFTSEDDEKSNYKRFKR